MPPGPRTLRQWRPRRYCSTSTGPWRAATQWVSADTVLAEHGYELPPDAYERWFNDGLDGTEHDEHSQSRDHYVAWQRERTLAMLAETDVHPGEYEEILTKLRGGAANRVIEAYDETPRPCSTPSGHAGSAW